MADKPLFEEVPDHKAGKTQTTKVTTEVVKPEEHTKIVQAEEYEQPSFGISEGTRNDLEQYGKTTDPFTGKLLTSTDKADDNKSAGPDHSRITGTSPKPGEGQKSSK